MSDLVLVETADRVRTLTVNRPEKLNALNSEVMAALDAALDGARGDASVGVVVITGAGEKSFIAGADIGELSKLTPVEGRAHARRGQAVLAKLETLGKPVIAAVNGYALGGGCELALACTIRVASENARFGQPEVKLGLIPGAGGTQRLQRIVGRGRALELVLTGETIDAAEAWRIGLVNRVVPAADLERELAEWTSRLQARSPLALARCLEAVHAGGEISLSEALRLESALFGLCFATEDMREGTAAFLEKRPPSFPGR